MQEEWVFVYGTLLRGMANHHLMEKYALVVVPAFCAGELRHLVEEGYPMLLTEPGEGGSSGYVVHGELVLLGKPEEVLPVLDWLEDYHPEGDQTSMYLRVKRSVTRKDTGLTVMAHTYVCPPEQASGVRARSVEVPGGDWRRFQQGRSACQKEIPLLCRNSTGE